MAIFTGRRLYTNNVQGTTTDNPLTDSATTMNSAGLANLAAVSGNHAVIVLDPLRAAGAPEIVIVTAHTGSATSATISRGAYSTTPRQHAAGTLWVHPVTKDDLIQVLTANPTDLFEGQFWYRSDTDIFMAHNGSAAVEALPIGAWQSYTPTLTASSVNPTLGTGSSQVGAYTRLGRTIMGRARIQFGSAGMAPGTGTYRIGLPVAPVNGGEMVVGTGRFYDISADDLWVCSAHIENTSAYAVMSFTSTGIYVVGAAAPVAMAASDLFMINFTYEAAS